MATTKALQGQIDRHEKLCGERYQEIERRLTGLEQCQAINNRETAQILEIVQMGRAFFKVGLYLGNFIKWAAPIGAALIAIWTWLEGT